LTSGNYPCGRTLSRIETQSPLLDYAASDKRLVLLYERRSLAAADRFRSQQITR
jgi:hypothetical protein